MKNHVNMLPLEFRRRILIATRARQWVTTFSICALLILVVIGIQWQRLGNQKQELEAKRIEAAPFRNMEETLEGMREELSRLHASRSLLAEARRSTQTVKLLGLVSHSANEKLQVQSFDFKSQMVDNQPDKTSGTKESPVAKSAVQTELVLSGIAKDNLAISQLLAGLKSGQVFDSVEVKKISESSSETTPVRSYSITCRINEAAQ